MRLREILASETVFLVATAGGAALVCALAFARLGFFGLVLVALVALFVSSRVRMDDDAPISTASMDADTRARLRREPGEYTALRRRAERASLARSLRFVRLGAGLLLAVGTAGVLAGLR
jgi:hypothetical protein